MRRLAAKRDRRWVRFVPAPTPALVAAALVWAGLAGAARGQAIDKQVLDRVKDATVFVKLKAGRMQGSGSGFVIRATGDTVLVMTNRHVAAPDVDELPKGEKLAVSVVFRSGTDRQQELPATVLAADDREVRDLAVLEVRGVAQPPRPIAAEQTSAESDFFETMPVYALGFPLGGHIQEVVDHSGADPSITVTAMSISSLRRDDARRLARVQLNGSLIEGNSGGPIVDAKGRLVGVAVSRLRGEAVGFAIPPSVIAGFLAGDVGGVTAELLAPEGGQARVKLSLRLIDPLGRLRAVAVRATRQGPKPAPPQADPRSGWAVLPGATATPLTVSGGAATGVLGLPVATADDRKVLVQFVLTDAAGRTSASKPLAVTLPDRPGRIAGFAAPERARTVARWSCELNLGEGATMAHRAGVTTIDVPGNTPLINAPQFKLYTSPCALVKVNGDFVAVVKVTNDFDPGGEVVTLPGGRKAPITFQGAGLLIWQDEKNFVRLERCKGSVNKLALSHRVLVEVYKDGKEMGVYYKDVPEGPIALLAVRKGGSVQFLFAVPPGATMVFREIALDFSSDLLVGVAASNLSKRPFQAKLEDFALKTLDGKDVEARPVERFRLVDGGVVRRADGTLVFEGATLKVARNTSDGTAGPQLNMGTLPGKWTQDRQFLWRASKVGDALTLEVPVEVTGKYEVKAKFSKAPEYARFKFSIDGKPLLGGKFVDLYGASLQPAGLMPLGVLSLAKGKHNLTATVFGKNDKASRFSLGLDELQLVPAP